MKKIIFVLIVALFSVNVFGQVKMKKPSVMIVPSKAWCKQMGYTQEFNNQGYVEVHPDFRKAFLNDVTLKQVLVSMSGVMKERKFTMKMLESQLDKVDKKIDYIINCAGILEKKPLLNQDISMIDTIIDTNLKGSLYVAKASYEYLKQTKGMLLFFTSSSYTRGRGEYAAYSSTKAGVVNLTQALDEEFFKDGIRVNCINPSRTLTPMRVKNFGNEPKESLLEAKDVAKKALMILTKEISGQIIDIKKGL